MFCDDITVLEEIRRHRQRRAEKALGDDNRRLRELDDQFDRASEARDAAQSEHAERRREIAAECRGATNIASLKRLRKQEDALKHSRNEHDETLASLDTQRDEQYQRIDNAKVSLKRRQVSLEKLVQLRRLLAARAPS